MTYKFQLGDLVKVTSPKKTRYNFSWMPEMNQFLGKVSKVVELNKSSDGLYYGLKLVENGESMDDGLLPFLFHEENLSKLEKENNMFKVGDIVKVKDNCPFKTHIGKVGKVDTIIKERNEVGLTFSTFKDGPVLSGNYVELYVEASPEKPKTTVSSVKWIRANSGTFTIVVDNKSYTIPKDHLNYAKIDKAVKTNDFSNIKELVDAKEDLTKFTAKVGNVEIKDGVLFRNGNPLHNTIANRIIDLYKGGYPIDAMVKFLDNLMQNPSKRAVDELYPFLEHHGLPITEDGCFLGYKRVRNDFKDHHSGKIDFSVGKVVEIERNTVDDNWRLACSSGIHVGCIEYVRNFHPGSPVVIVKVNPKDVVSVPSTEVTKMRVAKLEVVKEYDKELVKEMDGPLYTADGNKVESHEDWDDDELLDDDGW